MLPPLTPTNAPCSASLLQPLNTVSICPPRFLALFLVGTQARIADAVPSSLFFSPSPDVHQHVQGRRRQYTDPEDKPGPVAGIVYDELTGIQQQRKPDPHGWVREVPLL